MLLRHRSAVLVGGTCVAALAGLVIATTPHSSGQGLGAGTSTQAAAQGPAATGPRPPLKHAKASGLAPDFRPADSAAFIVILAVDGA
jgi:hypothetical protein